MDFLGVAEEFQRRGRGRRLMTALCGYADSVDLPIMLFNSPDLVEFYESLGFDLVAEVSSEDFGFSNAYMVRGG